MVIFFDRLYSSIKNKNSLLVKLRYYSCLRVTIRLIANIILPIYFRIIQSEQVNYVKTRTKTEGRVIVSLTSYPARINRLWLVIETLLRQTQKPDKIILWLSEEQFPDLRYLPKNLLRLQKKGLEIRLCPKDLGSHKKYYYAFKEYPEDIIITVDDDVFYNARIIEDLVKSYKEFPTCVSCNNCSEIKLLNNQIQPYVLWEDYSISGCPSYKIFAIGIGGVLYPPNIFDPTVFDTKIFIKYCYTADDIWLNIMSKLAETMVVKSKYDSSYLPVMNFRNIHLSSINVNEGLNDKQLISVRNYCIEYLGKDPFKNLLN